MRRFFILSVLVLLLTGCGSSVTISLGTQPTATAVPTATSIPTATPNLDATATAQAQSTATAQTAATTEAQSTAQAQSSATAQAQATARAQQTATAAAQASATQQALLAYVDGLVQKANKAYGPADGVLDQKPNAPLTVATLRTGLYVRNFVAEARFFNPADGAVHPWDYGFAFRIPPSGRCSPEYRFRVNSDQTYQLTLITGINPDQTCSQKVVSSGTSKQLDVSPTGANLIRLVVQDKSAYAFVNGAFLAAMDASENNGQGDIWIGSGMQVTHEFPGLAARYAAFVVSSLP